MAEKRITRKAVGAGEAAVVAILGSDYRLWASLPDNVEGLLALSDPDAAPQKNGTHILAAVPRPVFPPGVCTSCGCSETDPCFYPRGSQYAGLPCGWADTKHTKCTKCANVSPYHGHVDGRRRVG